MGRPRLEAPINPIVLAWVRNVIHMPTSVAAERLKVKPEQLDAWETGSEKPSFPQLLKLANLYKRSPGFFFLSAPPNEAPPPKDFRVLADEETSALSPDTLVELRSIIGKRLDAIEISTALGDVVPPFKYSTNLEASPEKLGVEWRNRLKITPEIQESWSSEYDALFHWRSAIEKLGVLVFQAPVDTLEEFRGIAIHHERLPIIILNTKDTARGKIFSLLHEFCHLLLHVSGIGNMEPPQNRGDETNEIEVFCNAFAGACLVPADQFLREPQVIEVGKTGKVTTRILNGLVSLYQASWEVILRRFLELDLISSGTYKETRKELLEKYSRGSKKPEGGPPWHVRKLAHNGHAFTSLVLRGGTAGVITRSDVSTILGVKLNHLPKLEALIARGND